MFARELGAVGEVGWLLARGAAVLAGRMEQLAERDMAMASACSGAARDELDRDRWAERNRWAAALEGDDTANVAETLANLATSPPVLDILHQTWGRVADGLRSADAAVVAAAAGQARKLLCAMEVDAPGDPAVLATAVAAEVTRLRGRDERLRGALGKLIAGARKEVRLVAAFDISAEAKLARRHEAAERGLFRAFKLIRDLRCDAGLGPAVEPETHADLPSITPEPESGHRPIERPSRPSAPPAALGSFRPGTELPPATVGRGPLASFCIGVEADRRRRPDLAKIRGKRR